MSWLVFSLIVTIGIFPITIVIAWAYTRFIDLSYMILIALSLPVINGTIWLIYVLVRRSKIKNEQVLLQDDIVELERNFIDFRKQLRNFKTKRTKIEVLKICDKLVYTGDVSNQICNISKIPFKSKDVVVSCPYCMKKYKRKYLMEWLEKKDDCPVCRVKIIVR